MDVAGLVYKVTVDGKAGVAELKSFDRATAETEAKTKRSATAIEASLDKATASTKRMTDAIRKAGSSDVLGGMTGGFSSLRAQATSLDDVLNRFRPSSLMAAAGIAGVGAAALGAVHAFGKLIESGQKFQQMEMAFGTLTARIGQNSEALLEGMRRATRGFVSDVELMRLANQAIILGLPVSADSMEDLAAASVKLGRAMGVDATQALESVITGIGRESRMWLDNIGIVVDANAAYSAMAAKLGKTTEQLTEAERKLAFYQAVQESATRAAQGLGGAELTVAESLKQVKVAAANATDELGKTANRWQFWLNLMNAMRPGMPTAWVPDLPSLPPSSALPVPKAQPSPAPPSTKGKGSEGVVRLTREVAPPAFVGPLQELSGALLALRDLGATPLESIRIGVSELTGNLNVLEVGLKDGAISWEEYALGLDAALKRFRELEGKSGSLTLPVPKQLAPYLTEPPTEAEVVPHAVQPGQWTSALEIGQTAAPSPSPDAAARMQAVQEAAGSFQGEMLTQIGLSRDWAGALTMVGDSAESLGASLEALGGRGSKAAEVFKKIQAAMLLVTGVVGVHEGAVHMAKGLAMRDPYLIGTGAAEIAKGTAAVAMAKQLGASGGGGGAGAGGGGASQTFPTVGSSGTSTREGGTGRAAEYMRPRDLPAFGRPKEVTIIVQTVDPRSAAHYFRSDEGKRAVRQALED